MQIGIEAVQANPNILTEAGPFTLVCNQASVNQFLEPTWQILHRMLPGQMKSLMGPQHGFESTVQDNMIESSHALHLPTGLPVYSLYSETREPTEEMLHDVDTIIVDLQISGTRIYTYKYTLAACLRAAKKFNKKVIVLDRPNPLGGIELEGHVLEADCKSFVGEFEIPMRHGLTPGEAAIFFNSTIGCSLEVVWMSDWDPNHQWGDLGRPWILTSPNLPTPDSAYIYPGTVLFEGTSLSEGRGTTRPFQMLGAAEIKDPRQLKDRTIKLLGREPAGLFLRPTSFQPTFHKYAGRECGGVDLIIRNPSKIRSYDLGICLIRAFFELINENFSWIQPGYEYNFDELPINLIMGFKSAASSILGESFAIDDPIWHAGVSRYREHVRSFLHYEREHQCESMS